MPYEMECPGITFAVQWKKKSRTVSRREDVTSIGLWDFDDSTLDWQTFKSYVCQNLGTADNISVAYVDSDGDELPIESECEFREALKFARQRARNGRETILKVDRQESTGSCSPICKVDNSTNLEETKSLLMLCNKQNSKPGSKSGSEFSSKSSQHEYSIGLTTAMNTEGKIVREKENVTCKDFEKPVIEHSDLVLKVAEQLQKMNVENEDVPPVWFKRYMQKMKSEIVAEVTRNIFNEIHQAFPSQKVDSGASRGNCSWSLNKNKKKKKISDEDSSDGTLGCESRDHKLLKKIEKLHKREKKLEKKLDSKLEKLENKTKRMMEKRSQCKARCERVPERKFCHSAKRRSGDLHFRTYLMDAILLDEDPISEIVISPGEQFTKVWEIMNAGTLPWTDKTELRQAWGSLGLEPEETVVKCPILLPGEKGTINVKFHAPEFPGTFKSYWHFYHMGDRFGHWLCCTVMVLVKVSKVNQSSVPELDDLSASCEENKHTTDSAEKTESDVVRKHQQCHDESDEKNGTSLRQVEYESDLESDNLSVISGPGSVSSETEDENFVVIPMPACFVCDVPLGSTETVPVVVKSDSRKAHSSTSNRCETKKKANLYKEMDMENTSDTGAASTSKQSNMEYEDKPLEKVYAVDSRGCCVAVSYSENAEGCETKEEEQAPKDSSDSTIGRPFDETTESLGPDGLYSSGSSAHGTSRSLAHDPLTNVIHILPETLVTGAVNVASSAFSTARAVISNLRSRHSWDGSEWQWSNVAMPPTDGTTSENLNILLEMGFTNRILNVLLLQQYDNDICRVVAELVSYEDGTNGNQG